MSLFRKPKKNIQRRAFSEFEDGQERGNAKEHEESERDAEAPKIKTKSMKPDKAEKPSKERPATKTLLSFGDEEEEEEVFQVKKTSQSKKVMRQMDKERRRKAKGLPVDGGGEDSRGSDLSNRPATVDGQSGTDVGGGGGVAGGSLKGSTTTTATTAATQSVPGGVSGKKIHTEIRTDDFVLVVKKSEPELILNGRAAFCAGKDDMSSEEDEEAAAEEENGGSGGHRFNNNFKFILESGGIPDAAMIHAARKSRQKARELGDFVPIEADSEEKKVSSRGGKKSGQNDDDDDDNSEEEQRIDMSAITGVKEREERREQFYSAQNNSDEDSDYELKEWENQQIRKGVTGAQLVSAQQESAMYFMPPSANQQNTNETPLSEENMSTGQLLEQAYQRNCIEKPKTLQQVKPKSSGEQRTGPKKPQEVLQKLLDRLQSVKELNRKHFNDVDQMMAELKMLKLDTVQVGQSGPVAAGQYRFYQELRGFVSDFVECMDEKLPQIVDLEKRANSTMSKFKSNLIERRRQDVKDQAKELSDQAARYSGKKVVDDEERVRRAAEREGRRTRRRRARERANLLESHLDGMSSDDEVPDQDESQYKSQLQQIMEDSLAVFDDTTDEFCDIRLVLKRFQEWKRNDLTAYKDAYVSVCLPKVVGPLIRVRLLAWNPFLESAMDFEKSDWYRDCMMNGYDPMRGSETEKELTEDPDVRFVPAVVEKIILPKLTEQVELCWDPLSTSQTLKLVGLVGRLGREYPSLRPKSKITQSLFTAILDKMQSALDNDVFIPIFAKQTQEAKTSFFQRQFCSGLKLFRNMLSWQGIISDAKLREIAILSLLNRYLLSAMRVCTATDAVSKAHIIVYTLPRVWLQPDSELLPNMEMFTAFLKHTASQLEPNNPVHMESVEKILKILSTLHSTL